MCGIMGYVGDRETTKVILDGLEEYRGYTLLHSRRQRRSYI